MKQLAAHMLILMVGCACSPQSGCSHDVDRDTQDTLQDSYEDTAADITADGVDTEDILDAQDDDAEASDPCRTNIEGPMYDLSYLEEMDTHLILPTDCGECCRQISYTEYGIENCHFDISGKYAVFLTLNESPRITRVDIVDLTTLKHYRIAETSFDEFLDWFESTNISGESVIYHEVLGTSTSEPMTTRFNMLNIASGETRAVFEIEHALGLQPGDISFTGQWLAWKYHDLSLPEDRTHLYVLNLDWTEPRIVHTERTPLGIDMFDDKVVFGEDFSWIRVYNISDDSFTDVAGGPEYDWDRHNPAIWENLVAWHDARNGGTATSQTYTDIYMKDITGGDEVVVCDNPATQPRQLDVGYGYVVWPDARNDPDPNSVDSGTNLDIYGLDIESGTEFVVSALPGGQYCPMIVENRVYFVMRDSRGIMTLFEQTL